MTHHSSSCSRPVLRLVPSLLLLLVNTAPSVSAQETSILPRDHLQVTSPAVPYWRTEGKFIAVQGDTLVLGRRGGLRTHRIPIQQIERLRVQRGTKDARWRGALLGAPIGFAVGSILDEASRDVSENLRGSYQVGGSVIGVIVGWVIGRFVPTDRWVDVAPSSIGRRISDPAARWNTDRTN